MTIRSPTPASPAKGLLFSSQGHPQPGHLRQPPGHEQCLGVVPAAHAVAAAGAEGDDVLQGGAQLGAHLVGAGVDPEAGVHKQVLHLPGQLQVLAGRHHAGWDMAAHLLGVGGAGEHHHGAVALELLLNDLAEAEGGVLLDALGHGDHDGPRVGQLLQLGGSGADRKGRGGHHHGAAALHRPHIGGQAHCLGQRHPFSMGFSRVSRSTRDSSSV